MKIHHEGSYESQDDYLAGKTGLPHVDSAIAMSEMKMNGHSGPEETA